MKNAISENGNKLMLLAAALLLTAGLAFAARALSSRAERRAQAAYAEEYDEATALMDEGRMDEALKLLDELPFGYKDKYELASYIEALELYEKGKTSHSYYIDAVLRLRYVPEDYSGPYAARIRELRKRAQAGYERGAAQYRAAHCTPVPSPTPDFFPVTPSESGCGDYDPYNAADFVGPEDFYDANWDAFDNIDDAETYWYEHQ